MLIVLSSRNSKAETEVLQDQPVLYSKATANLKYTVSTYQKQTERNSNQSLSLLSKILSQTYLSYPNFRAG